jgi:hypothetical protein
MYNSTPIAKLGWALYGLLENILLYKTRKKFIGKKIECIYCGDREVGICTGVHLHIVHWPDIMKYKHYRDIGFPILMFIIKEEITGDNGRSFYGKILDTLRIPEKKI